MHLALFILFALVSVISALYVVVAKNPINSAIALVISLVGVACLYVQLEAHFLAIIQVLIYAGAIMVLFLFVIMLLNLTPEQLGSRQVTAGRVASTVLVGGLAVALVALIAWGGVPRPAVSGTGGSEELTWAGGTVAAVGGSLFSDYLLPFEIASVLLLVAIVGAVVIAKRRS
ncbi:MAG: NADH-quinone oxidoreductase subunit J [Bradymonadales bacterium]|nr:NADH-quinone oxidoreductase subunit J [Bradymonadales bacterium]